MKIRMTIFFALIIELLFSQNLTEIAREKELTWYGVDFTISRFIGFEKDELTDCPILEWGFTVKNENDKNLIEYYFKKSLIYNTETAAKRNDTINCIHLMTKHTYSLDYDDISNVVKQYEFIGDGYGVLLIVESFEKIDNSVFIWVVYIQNSSGQIISARRYIGGDYGGRGDKCSKEGIELVIKLSGKDLKNYK